MDDGARVAIPRTAQQARPYAVRIREQPEKPRSRVALLTFPHLLIGEKPISFNMASCQVGLADRELDVAGWLELRRRIDLMFVRAGVLEKVAPARSEWEGGAGGFLSRNWRAVLNHPSRVGMWKRPPWFLRWLYSAVITKETYGSQ